MKGAKAVQLVSVGQSLGEASFGGGFPKASLLAVSLLSAALVLILIKQIDEDDEK